MKHTIIFIIITILMTIPSNFSRGESLEVFSWWTAPGEIEGLAHGSAIKEPLTSVLHDQLISFLSGQDEKKTSKNIMEYALKFGLE